MENLKDTRIINIDASELFYAKLTGNKIEIKNNGKILNEKFTDIIPPNLDFYYLQEQGKLSIKQCSTDFYSYDFVNVSFKFPLYVNNKNEHIIPKSSDKEKYHKYSLEKIRKFRKELYLNGFELNGKTYVRYKRSSGSAKGGSCLFIKKELFAMMDKWSKAGLDERKDNYQKNLTSYEAYRALSLSSLITTLDLNPYNILFVKDYKHTLKNQTVIKVTYDKEKGLIPQETYADIENNIFDGEGLLDASVFNQAGKTKKGMMLLRSRYFKCCAFNTNLKKWFEDNNITSLDQLNGITYLISSDAKPLLTLRKSKLNENPDYTIFDKFKFNIQKF